VNEEDPERDREEEEEEGKVYSRRGRRRVYSKLTQGTERRTANIPGVARSRSECLL
jgi:hypothetical protein